MQKKIYETGCIYVNEAQARLAFEGLADLPLRHPELTLLEPIAAQSAQSEPRFYFSRLRHMLNLNNPQEKRLLETGMGSGIALGTGASGLGSVFAVTHGATLFVSTPVLSSLALTGGGAALGAAIGVGIAMLIQRKSLSHTLTTARQGGHWCMQITTYSEEDHQSVLAFLATWPEVQVQEVR